MAPTSSGPGIADLPWVAVTPISLAYSGSICATEPVPRVARCHASTNATKIATETTAARTQREQCEECERQPGSDHDAFLIAKLLRYSSGFDGSKVLPMTEKDFDVVVGGVSPTSFISLVVSVARNTCLATPA